MLWQERGVVNTIVDRGTSSSVSLIVYRGEKGGRNNKYNANICMTMHDMTMSVARCALIAVRSDTGEGGEHSGKYS